jgi:hypothetical protein
VARRFLGNVNSKDPFAGCPQRAGQRTDTRVLGGTDRNGAVRDRSVIPRTRPSAILEVPGRYVRRRSGSGNLALC